MVDGMVVPVADPPAQRSVQRDADQIDTRLHEPATQQAALAPGIPPVTFTHPSGLQAHVEGTPRRRAGQDIPGLALESVERSLPLQPLGLTAQPVQALSQAHPSIEAVALVLAAQADV